jgi:hypothetical protein
MEFHLVNLPQNFTFKPLALMKRPQLRWGLFMSAAGLEPATNGLKE